MKTQQLTQNLRTIIKSRNVHGVNHTVLYPETFVKRVDFMLCVCVCFFFFNHNPQRMVAQMVKNLPAVRETWVRSLGWEDPLEEGMATHSSILAWRIPMDRGAWRATVHRGAKSQTQLSDYAQHIVLINYRSSY